MNKYFIVENLKLALLMKGMLGQDFKTFHDKDKDRYSFLRVDRIDKIYGLAKTILEII